MFKVSKKNNKSRTMCQIYSKWTLKTSDWNLVCLFLTLNILAIIYSTVNIAAFEQINVGRVWEMVGSGNKFVSSNYEKCTVQWAGIICWAMCFHYHSPKIRLQKEFSWQLFKKINWTLYRKRKLDQELNSSSELITWALDLSVDKLTGFASSKMTQMLPKIEAIREKLKTTKKK